MPDKGWHHPLHDSIPLPKGGELQTLRDAGNFIAKLPKREHDAPEWRAAIQALMPVATHGGDTMLPRIGILQALNRRPVSRRPVSLDQSGRTEALSRGVRVPT